MEENKKIVDVERMFIQISRKREEVFSYIWSEKRQTWRLIIPNVCIRGHGTGSELKKMGQEARQIKVYMSKCGKNKQMHINPGTWDEDLRKGGRKWQKSNQKSMLPQICQQEIGRYNDVEMKDKKTEEQN